ncbi:MAG: hypothetical protein ACD_39C01680G0002 [uncultured bacterium]|nr:MAG: hypothetical protein ACD_39C01680G0002 [uncultured bacterium]
MKWLKVAQVAEDLGVSKAAVYKRIKSLQEKLTPHLRQENGKTFVSTEGFNMLQQSMRSKEGTLWEDRPAETKVETTLNQHSTESLKLNETFNQLVDEMKGELKQKNQTIDKLLFQMEEDRKRQAEERQRTDTIIMKLAHDLEATRKSALAIEAKVDALAKPLSQEIKLKEVLQKPAPEVRPWEPPVKATNPIVNKPWYKKLWVQVFEPWKLRQQPY